MNWFHRLLGALFKSKVTEIKSVEKPAGLKAPWMEFVLREQGQAEVPGDGDNPRIVEYFKATSLKVAPDAVAWCAAFANWALMRAAIPGTSSAAALSFLKWGRAIKIPEYGCIVVFDHGNGHGHVAFFEHYRDDGFLGLIGGNQHDSVCLLYFAPNSVAAYRMPL